jgi:NADH-quinone oxidoreductase subunit A
MRMRETVDPQSLLALGLYGLAILGMSAIMIGAAHVLGPRRRGPADPNPFESGILPIQDVHIRFPVQFYVIAMLFVIFDLEMVFVFAWAVAARPAGWLGYGGMLGFLLLLLIALAYLWRDGALEWSSSARPRR